MKNLFFTNLIIMLVCYFNATQALATYAPKTSLENGSAITITCFTQVSPISCPAIPVWIAPTASSTCGIVTITFSDSIASSICPGTYTIIRTWIATDPCNNTEVCYGIIDVEDYTSPVITCSPQTTPLDCPSTPIWANAVAVDACDPVLFITFNDNSVSGTCFGTFTTTRTWTATDDCGNSATCTRTISVIDSNAPIITCQSQNSPISCAAAPIWVSAVAVDACDPVLVITFSDNIVAGICPQTFTAIRTWTATDDCGNSSTCSGTISITDPNAPIITCQPQNSPISCAAPPIWINPIAVDACDLVVAISFTDNTVAGTCVNNFDLVRTWIATDDCGNSSTCLSIIKVQDITPPVFSNCPPNHTVGTDPGICTKTNNNIDPTASDACGSSSMTKLSGPITGSILSIGTYSFSYVATDLCNNTASCNYTLTVVDNNPPIIACSNIISTISTGSACSKKVNYNFPVTDNCGVLNTIYNPPSGTIFSVGTHTVIASSTDINGNIGTCSFTVTVLELIKPKVTCKNKSIKLNTTTSVTISTSDVTQNVSDNCAVQSITAVPNTFNCSSPNINPVLVTVTDVNGNSKTCNVNVTITSRLACPPQWNDESNSLNTEFAITNNNAEDRTKTLDEESVTIIPNPATDNIEVQFGRLIASGKIRIMNLQGKIVYEHVIQNKANAQIEFSDHLNWTGGLYYLQLQIEQDTYTKPLVIIR